MSSWRSLYNLEDCILVLVIYLPKITVSIFGLQNAVFKPSTRSLNPCHTKVIASGAVSLLCYWLLLSLIGYWYNSYSQWCSTPGGVPRLLCYWLLLSLIGYWYNSYSQVGCQDSSVIGSARLSLTVDSAFSAMTSWRAGWIYAAMPIMYCIIRHGKGAGWHLYADANNALPICFQGYKATSTHIHSANRLPRMPSRQVEGAHMETVTIWLYHFCNVSRKTILQSVTCSPFSPTATVSDADRSDELYWKWVKLWV